MKKNNHNAFLSFSLAKGFTSPNIPIVTFYQGDKELNFIIDTGSDDNVISKEALDSIEYEMIDYKGIVYGIGGNYDVEGCNITFEYEGETFTGMFIVSDNLREAFASIRKCHAIPLHGMLGSKFLKENNIVLDFKTLVAYSKK